MNKCPKCGTEVKSNQIFCNSCGSRLFENERNILSHPNLVEQDNNQSLYQEPQYNSQLLQDNVATDSELINAYIGKNADEFNENGFSFCALFFGTLYAFYRQMNILGIIWLFINIIILLIFPSYYYIITFILTLLMSIYFKKIYLKHVQKKVSKIKAKNLDKSKDELLKIMEQRGGTSISAVLLVMIILVFISYNTVSSIIKKYYDLSKEKLYAEMSDLSINIPESFSETNYSTPNYRVFETETSNIDKCSIIIQISDIDNSNNDIKRYLNSSITITSTDNYSGIQEEIINDNTWYYASVLNYNTEKYYYSASYENKVYKIIFTINSDSSGSCHTAFNQVVGSLRFNND